MKIGVRNNDLSKMDGEYYLSRIPVIKQLLDGEEIDITTPVDAPVSYHKKER